MKHFRLLAFGLIGLAAPATLEAQLLADYDYEDLAFRGIGFDWGYVWPNKVEATPAYGLRADFGYLGPGVRIVPSLQYWSSTVEPDELGQLASHLSRLPGAGTILVDALGPIDWNDLSLNLDGQFVWATPVQLFTYLGLGVGLHIMNGSGNVIDDTFIEDLLDTTTAGLSASAGVEYAAMRRLRLYTEARYTLLSDIHYPGIRIGGAYMLPTGSAALEGR